MNRKQARSPYRGRFAPSPTGELHLGSLTAALASWLDARAHAGEWLIRIEDIDTPRCVPGVAQKQIDALAAFGLTSDLPIERQSDRLFLYAEALDALRRRNLVFECRCSRSDLARTAGIHRRCASATHGHGTAWRLRVPELTIALIDRCCGPIEQSLRADVGDFVVCRADGLFAYQLAVVVDDAEQGITDVVRGADLLDVTPRQVFLQQCLGHTTPRYLHLPVVRDAQGRKRSKSDAATALRVDAPLPSLRAAWVHLGQDPRRLPTQGGVDLWLQAAVASFESAAIPASAPEAPVQFESEGSPR